MDLTIEILDDADAVAERGAAYVVEQAGLAVANHGQFAFAVSGGHTPWAMFAHLVRTMPWEKVAIYQVDQVVPPEAAAGVRAMPVNADDPPIRGKHPTASPIRRRRPAG